LRNSVGREVGLLKELLTTFNRTGKRSLLALHIYLVSFMVVVQLFLINQYLYSYGTVIYIESVCLLALFIWSLWSWKYITNSAFDPYVLFLFSANIFNAGQAWLQIFGLNPAGILDGMIEPNIVVQTLFLVFLSLSFLHFGAILGINTPPHREETSRRISLSDVRLVGWGLLFISLVPEYMQLKRAFGVAVAGGYMALYQTQAATGLDATGGVLSTFLVPGVLFLLAGSRDRRRGILISLLVLITYVMSELFLGYRSYAILLLVSYIWLWHRTIRPIPRSFLLIIGSFLLVVVIPLVRVIRNIHGVQKVTLGHLIQSYFSIDNPLVASLHEMGGSMDTVSYTLMLVPVVKNFQYGLDYLYSLLTVFPNLLWPVHPTIAHGLPSVWLTRTVDPIIAEKGGGYGFSFIAEAYMNFGWFGTPLVMLILGFLVSRFVLWANRTNEIHKLAMVATYTSFFLFYARAESAVIVRPLIWYAMCPYIIIHIVSDIRRVLNKSARLT
jgi:oligosaccharide repeat unit polymerase